jgi:hypothetical protein
MKAESESNTEDTSTVKKEFVEEDFLLTDSVDAALTSDSLPTLNALSKIVR